MELTQYIQDYTLKDKIRARNPKVAAFGGGTGLSSLLRGLKKYSDNITAIVTMGDDGGSSGMLREDLGILPPGDIRSCILALADDENAMQKLFNYRFDGGKLTGHSFGNLFLAAMTGISGDFYEAVRRTSDVLQITGRVLPVTLDEMVLTATLANGEIISGQSAIPKIARKKGTSIAEMALRSPAKALPEALEAIEDADIIIFGPGSLYTSIIPHLLVDGVYESLCVSQAEKYYVGNLMTQPGETTDFTQKDHVDALQAHCKYPDEQLFRTVIANVPDTIDPELAAQYARYGAVPIINSALDPGYRYIIGAFAAARADCVRHDADAVAKAIFQSYWEDGYEF